MRISDWSSDVCSSDLVLCRNHQLVGALQTLVQRLGSLHAQGNLPEIVILWGAPVRIRSGLVRAKGLEPPHLAILEPKSSASTSSATPACKKPRIPVRSEEHTSEIQSLMRHPYAV